MKICPKCNINKVKNSYLHCYNCNMKDDLSSEVDNEKEIKREPIPKCVRNALWINYFHAGHIKAHANGGSTSLDNLVPICMLCNCSMMKHDLNEFISKYNLHHGLEEL